MYILSTNKGEKFKFESGDSLLEILKQNKIIIENPCSGKGYCGKCKIKILEGLVDENIHEHRKYLTNEEIDNNIRLSCLYFPKNDLKVELITNTSSIKILDKGYLPEYNFNPVVKKEVINLDDSISTVIKYNGKIVGIENGNTTNDCYGLAIDIGTTTIVASLLNINNGLEIGSESSINPQKDYGLDVLSRIAYASQNDFGTKELHTALIDCLNNLIDTLCLKYNIKNEYIYDVTVAANTTMLHLLLGINPKSLGVNPYTPVFTESKVIIAKDIGLKLSNIARIYTLPSVSAFIGADITAGAIVSNLHLTNERVLFIDIGTNGEMILSDRSKMLACSCAAGPALEGMNITCGVRAVRGAIEGVKIINEDINLDIIGSDKPIGICGSGILEAISELYRIKLINKSGRIIKKDDFENSSLANKMLIQDGKKRSIVLSKENNIVINQNDIRQVQLAKGAILSGILSLTKKLDISIEDIDKVIIAGQFGAHLKIESLIGIGMVPSQFKNKTMYIGNSSKSGAILCLLDKSKRQEVDSVLNNCSYLELSLLDDYENIFTKCLSFDISKLEKEKVASH